MNFRVPELSRVEKLDQPARGGHSFERALSSGPQHIFSDPNFIDVFETPEYVYYVAQGSPKNSLYLWWGRGMCTYASYVDGKGYINKRGRRGLLIADLTRDWFAEAMAAGLPNRKPRWLPVEKRYYTVRVRDQQVSYGEFNSWPYSHYPSFSKEPCIYARAIHLATAVFEAKLKAWEVELVLAKEEL